MKCSFYLNLINTITNILYEMIVFVFCAHTDIIRPDLYHSGIKFFLTLSENIEIKCFLRVSGVHQVATS